MLLFTTFTIELVSFQALVQIHWKTNKKITKLKKKTFFFSVVGIFCPICTSTGYRSCPDNNVVHAHRRELSVGVNIPVLSRIVLFNFFPTFQTVLFC